jgi:hypothetical protein
MPGNNDVVAKPTGLATPIAILITILRAVRQAGLAKQAVPVCDDGRFRRSPAGDKPVQKGSFPW